MPRAMMDYGIIASIEYYILKLKNNAGFEITMTSDGKELKIEKKSEIALYRVLVSLISLVRKHKIDEFGMHFKCESPVQVILKVNGGVEGLKKDVLNNPEYGLLQKRIELHGGLLKFSFEEENNYSLIVITFNE